MPARRAHLTPRSSHGELAAVLAELREQFEVPTDFSSAALEEAAQAAPTEPALDLRELTFVTIDPAGSRDLDQAFHLERCPAGFRLRYAIADLPGFVRPGGALDEEARLRGQTLYLPDGNVPLHPRELSEHRASLLAGEDRTAFVWTIDLDGDATVTGVRVERASIRSRAQLDYAGAQLALDRGEAEGSLALLPEFGALRIEQERLRGGASLNMPDEEIVRGPDGYGIVRRFPLPIEQWNAQLSLLTGMAAGDMMVEGRIGVLRTMPAPGEDELDGFRDRVAALGTPWPRGVGYGDYLRSLDLSRVETPAVLQAAASLFRGSGYAAFDGEVPEGAVQAAIAAPYAHVTAPLRRLVDRWGLVVCESLCAGRPVPEWVRESLPDLPGCMRAAGAKASQITSAALDRVEAALLRDRVGEVLPATVLEVRGERARVQLSDPVVTASCPAGGMRAGTSARVRVVRADVPSGEVELEPVGPQGD